MMKARMQLPQLGLHNSMHWLSPSIHEITRVAVAKVSLLESYSCWDDSDLCIRPQMKAGKYPFIKSFTCIFPRDLIYMVWEVFIVYILIDNLIRHLEMPQNYSEPIKRRAITFTSFPQYASCSCTRLM